LKKTKGEPVEGSPFAFTATRIDITAILFRFIYPFSCMITHADGFK
jgi:hypothetical protein